MWELGIILAQRRLMSILELSVYNVKERPVTSTCSMTHNKRLIKGQGSTLQTMSYCAGGGKSAWRLDNTGAVWRRAAPAQVSALPIGSLTVLLPAL